MRALLRPREGRYLKASFDELTMLDDLIPYTMTTTKTRYEPLVTVGDKVSKSWHLRTIEGRLRGRRGFRLDGRVREHC